MGRNIAVVELDKRALICSPEFLILSIKGFNWNLRLTEEKIKELEEKYGMNSS